MLSYDVNDHLDRIKRSQRLSHDLVKIIEMTKVVLHSSYAHQELITIPNSMPLITLSLNMFKTNLRSCTCDVYVLSAITEITMRFIVIVHRSRHDRNETGHFLIACRL